MKRKKIDLFYHKDGKEYKTCSCQNSCQENDKLKKKMQNRYLKKYLITCCSLNNKEKYYSTAS